MDVASVVVVGGRVEVVVVVVDVVVGADDVDVAVGSPVDVVVWEVLVDVDVVVEVDVVVDVLELVEVKLKLATSICENKNSAILLKLYEYYSGAVICVA